MEYIFNGERHVLNAPVGNAADLENLAGALAFMLLEGVDTETIDRRFRVLHKIGTGLNVSEGVNGCSIAYDSYTSDFSSLRPAIDFMMRRKMRGRSHC